MWRIGDDGVRGWSGDGLGMDGEDCGDGYPVLTRELEIPRHAWAAVTCYYIDMRRVHWGRSINLRKHLQPLSCLSGIASDDTGLVEIVIS